MTKTARSAPKRKSIPVLHPTPGSHSPLSDAEALHRVRDLLFGEASTETSNQLDALASEMRTELASVRRELKEEAASLRDDLRAEIAEVKELAEALEQVKLARKDLSALLVGVADQLQEVG